MEQELKEKIFLKIEKLSTDQARKVLEYLKALEEQKDEPIETWAHRRIRQYTLPEDLPYDQQRIEEMTVKEYLMLSEKEQDQLWDKWEREAEKMTQKALKKGLRRG